MNVPLLAVAGDFKVHCSALTVGLREEAEHEGSVRADEPELWRALARERKLLLASSN